MSERNAVVTGGGTGIGRAVGLALAADGCRVLLVGRRTAVLDRAAHDINAAAGAQRALVHAADLTRPTDVERLAEYARTELATVDVLVNNAGGGWFAPVDGLQGLANKWLTLMTQNVVSAVLVTEALRPLLRRPGGRVVVVSSRSARSSGGEVAYAASKAALNRWVVTLASELGAEGMTANAVAPGFVPDTELFGAGIPDEWRQRIVDGIAVGRSGEPTDIAAAVRYLASPDAGFVNGTVLEVDGGTRVIL